LQGSIIQGNAGRKYNGLFRWSSDGVTETCWQGRSWPSIRSRWIIGAGGKDSS